MIGVGISGISATGCGPSNDAEPAADTSSSDNASRTAIQGRVLVGERPLAGARVRVQATEPSVQTDEQGRFRLPAQNAQPQKVTAAFPDHFIASATAKPGESIEIRLRPIPTADNDRYAWRDPRPGAGDQACGNCHERMFADWSKSGHASSATNARFLDLHAGTRHDGTPGGWNLRKEHPQGAAVCFACHAPTAKDEAVVAADFETLDAVAAQGVHCDYCHKIRDVAITELGLTHGRDALELRRPVEGEQLFFGPLDDVDRGDDVFSPIISQSQYCAACHEGTVFGMSVYTTYSEWLASAASREGKSCQSCHMPGDGVTTRAAKEGPERHPRQLSSHSMMPGGRLAMLRSAIRMRAIREARTLRVQLTTHNVGHMTPTGFIDRHLILVIDTRDEQPEAPSGADVVATTSFDGPAFEGPVLPQVAGVALAGKPGRLFGRIVRDREGQAPTPFWKAYDDPEDTRLKPDSSTSVHWRLPDVVADKPVRVRLLYRRFWEQVRMDKGWPDETLVVFEAWVSPEGRVDLPASDDSSDSNDSSDREASRVKR